MGVKAKVTNANATILHCGGLKVASQVRGATPSSESVVTRSSFFASTKPRETAPNPETEAFRTRDPDRFVRDPYRGYMSSTADDNCNEKDSVCLGRIHEMMRLPNST